MAAAMATRQAACCEAADREIASSTILALADILADVAVACNADGPDNKEHEMFYSVSAPSLDIVSYLKRMMKYMHCGRESFVAAAIYLRRIFNDRRDLPINKLSQHRLLLTSAVVAAKAHNDDVLRNSFYADVGGVSRRDMNRLEVGFMKVLGWRTHVTREEYQEMLELLETAAAADRRCSSFANWLSVKRDEKLSAKQVEPAAAKQEVVIENVVAAPAPAVQQRFSANQWVQAVMAACKPKLQEDDAKSPCGSDSTASTAASTPPFARNSCSREAHQTDEVAQAARKVARTC